jgi:hypothetical protein
VVRTVDEGDLDVDHREAGEDAAFEAGLDTLADRRDVLAGNAAAARVPIVGTFSNPVGG